MCGIWIDRKISNKAGCNCWVKRWVSLYGCNCPFAFVWGFHWRDTTMDGRRQRLLSWALNEWYFCLSLWCGDDSSATGSVDPAPTVITGLQSSWQSDLLGERTTELKAFKLLQWAHILGMTNDTFSRDTNRLIRSFVRATGQISEESEARWEGYLRRI